MTKYVFLLLAALLPGVATAQFNYTVNNNAVTITGYTGPAGAVNIPSTIAGMPVVSIKEWAFDPYYTGNFVSLTTVTIPGSVTNIDIEAFEYCYMTNVTFGAGVTSIGDGAFTYCSGLMAITADPNNPVYSTANGVLFDKNQTMLIQCPSKRAGIYVIPDSVTFIYPRAFYGCSDLTHVTIGNGVTGIGSGAFQNCTGLTSLVIPDHVLLIGNSFSYCSGLTNVTIGHGVISIGNDAFYYCTSLMNVSVPTNVNSIGSEAFAGCASLTNVILEGGVKLIDRSAFANCTSLPAIVIPGSVTNIGASAFYYCTRLGAVTIPGNVMSVGGSAFNSCRGLTNVTIRNGVTTIGDNAFGACPLLTSVTIPQSVISIGAAPFVSCTVLSAVTVDAGNPAYSSVDGVLFNKSQTALIQWPDGRGGSYIVPNSVTNIGAGAFESCVILTNVTIGAGVTGIGNSAFGGCTNLTGVYFSGNAPAAGFRVFGGYEIPNDTKAIAYYLPGTAGWSATFAGIPTAMWLPTILTFEPSFGVRTNFGFAFSWAANIPVVVEACTNLANPVWSSLATQTLTGGSAYFTDAQWTNYPDRFYRLRSP